MTHCIRPNHGENCCSTTSKVLRSVSAPCSHKVWKCSPVRPSRSASRRASKRIPNREPGAQGDQDDPARAPLETTPAATISGLAEPEGLVNLAALQTRSRKLEALRAAIPRQPQVERAGTAMTIAELEDRIALVDVRLGAAGALGLTEAQKHALWKERVNLMQSLVQVEYARLQRPRY